MNLLGKPKSQCTGYTWAPGASNSSAVPISTPVSRYACIQPTVCRSLFYRKGASQFPALCFYYSCRFQYFSANTRNKPQDGDGTSAHLPRQPEEMAVGKKTANGSITKAHSALAVIKKVIIETLKKLILKTSHKRLSSWSVCFYLAVFQFCSVPTTHWSIREKALKLSALMCHATLTHTRAMGMHS